MYYQLGGTMKTLILGLITAISFTSVQALAAVQNPFPRTEILENLVKMRDEAQNKTAELELKIRKSIERSMNPDEIVAPSEKEIKQMRAEMKDIKFKQNFLDRLIFQVDTRWKEQGEFKKFLTTTIQDLAKQEATNTDKDGDWAYISQLGLVLKETAADRGENPMSLVQDYLKQSTLQKPLKPKDFLSKRHYSNGKLSTQSETPEKDTVGDLVDKKLQSL